MVSGFSLHCFFKCNLHFQSVLICWVLIAGNVTKTSIRNWILPIPITSQLNTFKAILLTIFCSMDETLDIRLPLWFAISNSALKSNSLKKNSHFYWNLKMGVVMCVSHTQTWLPVSLWRRVLSWDCHPL